ncbi:hypothetical protein P389DRAFT_60409 [Cystobasidium minutum MCA 4210]|uniref:uncharacterized protein n=1 Tax=Cystobasidium minutum MCA 4210 TaxID=1397322 RepID=UPI0034CD46F8|eukprot:jgi/Rhomi1/60409/CE60408_499
MPFLSHKGVSVALATLLTGCKLISAGPVPSFETRDSSTPPWQPCQISVFDKSMGRSSDYCNALFDARGNCHFAGYNNDTGLPSPDPAWSQSNLSRVSVPKSLWELHQPSDNKTYNSLCGSIVTFQIANGTTVDGIIADHMDREFFDTCEGGIWRDLGFKGAEGYIAGLHDATYTIKGI